MEGAPRPLLFLCFVFVRCRERKGQNEERIKEGEGEGGLEGRKGEVRKMDKERRVRMKREFREREGERWWKEGRER